MIGGGITGLSAAHALRRAGIAFRLVERAPRPGGVILSERADGFIMEVGPDTILAQKPEAVDLCREIGLGPRLVPTNPEHRTVSILVGGRLRALPEGLMLAVPTRIVPFLRSDLFSWWGKLRMGLDLVLPARRANVDESIAAFLRRRFGQEAVDRIGEPLLAGIHSGDPERLSMHATFPRFVALERKHGSLVRGMRKAPRPRHAGPPPPAFYSLVEGLGELPQTLVGTLPPESLLLGRAVSAVERNGDSWCVRIEGGEALRARALVLAVPPPRAASLLQPLDASIASDLEAIRFVSTVAVYLGFRREDVRHPLDAYGFLVPKSERLRTTAVSFFSTKFPGRAPAGQVLLRSFLGGDGDEAILDEADGTLLEIVRREMGGLLGITAEPVLSRVYRWPKATPQMEVGHLARMVAVDRRLSSIPGLFLAGAGVRSTGIPDSVAEGLRSAEHARLYIQRTGETPAS